MTHHVSTSRNPHPLSLIGSAVVIRAAVVASILGTVLTVVNQFDALIGTADLDLLSLALVFMTPFVVVTVSQVLGIARAMVDGRGGGDESRINNAFLTTLVSHGIPRRAALVGAIVGTVNTVITAFVILAETGELSAFPFAVIGQAFVLPVLFGLISQAVSYRRAVRTVQAEIDIQVSAVSA